MPSRPLALARQAAELLACRGIENARLDAELLLADVLGVGRLELYLQHERPVTSAELARYRAAIRRRLRREPLQYITGRTQFRDLELEVDRRVLIPRPETELLVAEVLRWVAARAAEGAWQGSGPGALDVGTGSGAIALSLAAEGPFTRIVATDVSQESLALARANAERLGLASRIEFRQGDVYDPIPGSERFDVIVSNPPYVGEEERERVQPEVRDWEPPVALYAGPDGLELLRRLVAGAASRLARGGLLALEVGDGQAGSVAAMIQAEHVFTAPRVIRDLAGRERLVTATMGALANSESEVDNAGSDSGEGGRAGPVDRADAGVSGAQARARAGGSGP